MTKEHLYVILIFVFGMLIAMAFIVDAYIKFIRTNKISLKVAQQSSKWKIIQQTLEKEFSYYKKLPDSLKTDFTLRTYQFMQKRNWISSSKPIVSTYHKTLISASAVQLTFGLKQVSFGRFKTILIHEDAYYNRFTKKYHRGEVNQVGLIVLSWKHFEQGYADEKDKINLGLHEMAHALDLALHLSEGRRYNVHRLMDKFRESAFEKMLALRKNPNGFLRQYGSTNPREFFSVAVEQFFEAPEDFRTQMPELYYELCQLLNQDPCNKIFRGFQSIHSHQFKNILDARQLKIYKPRLNLRPNANIIIPFASYTLLVGLVIPVINLSINKWDILTYSTVGILYFLGLIMIFSKKGKDLKIIDSHLLSKTLIFNKDLFSVHLKNIVNINFTYMLTYYSTEISYFEGDDIKTKQLSLYFSPASIKKLERLLLQQSIRIKHNNKWLKKEDS
jgi:Mlc titration factor MtfA (ptsG expression regulator)